MSVENIHKFAEKIGKTKAFIELQTVGILNENAKVIEDMNRKQLEHGVGGDGQKLGDYTYMSKKIRAEHGRQTSFVDLNFEGDFYKSIVAEGYSAGGSPFVDIEPTDWKWKQKCSGKEGSEESLQARYPNAIGLDKEHREEVGGIIAKKLSRLIANFWKI